jgi:hypothetical protein
MSGRFVPANAEASASIALCSAAPFSAKRKIVVEGGVDDGVRVGCAGAQALEIFQAPAADGDAGRSEGGRSSFGAR